MPRGALDCSPTGVAWPKSGAPVVMLGVGSAASHPLPILLLALAQARLPLALASPLALRRTAAARRTAAGPAGPAPPETPQCTPTTVSGGTLQQGQRGVRHAATRTEGSAARCDKDRGECGTLQQGQRGVQHAATSESQVKASQVKRRHAATKTERS